jgi:hypothetical protein
MRFAKAFEFDTSSYEVAMPLALLDKSGGKGWSKKPLYDVMLACYWQYV